jgi:hypothetical protein
MFSAFRLKFRLKLKIKRFGPNIDPDTCEIRHKGLKIGDERFRRWNIRNNLLFDAMNMVPI